MRTMLTIALVTGCTSSAAVPVRPLGVQGHLTEADRHDADAAALEQRAQAEDTRAVAAPPYVCGDQALADLSTSGGERLGARAPCWRGESGAVARDRAAAAHLRADAHVHRAQARALVISQQTWCAGLPASELDHTPFEHREDIVEVTAELDSDRVRGARIRFAQVPGLTAEWLRQTLACHHALAAATGFEPTYLASCPAVVLGAETTVLDDPAGLVVVVRASDAAAGLTIYARAEALLGPASAATAHVH